MLRYVLVLGLALGFCGAAAYAQDAPRVEVFGGYSYLNADFSNVAPILNQLGFLSASNRLSLNGWDASLNVNLDRGFGLEADFSGHYRGDCEGVNSVTCKDLSFMGGPRFSYRIGKITAFTHGLFGGDTASASVGGSVVGISDISLSASNTSFALAAGGGLDYAVTNRISIRLGQADYFLTRHFNDVGIPSQNNFRVAAGIVFTFGGEREASRPARTRSAYSEVPERSQASSEAALLGVFGHAADTGFVVTSLRDGSPAAQGGIAFGDIITEIDGRSVHSSGDIESAIAASQTGTVKVSYLIVRGQWLTVKEIKIR